MKLAAKILNIITGVSCIIGAVCLFIMGALVLFGGIDVTQGSGGDANVPALIFGIPFLVGGLFCLLPAIIAFAANNAMNKAICKDQIVLWAIVVLIFINPISGILMLLIEDSELASDQKVNTYESQTNTNNVSVGKVSSEDELYTKISNLKKLLDDGAISQEEYNKCKAKILNKNQ